MLFWRWGEGMLGFKIVSNCDIWLFYFKWLMLDWWWNRLLLLVTCLFKDVLKFLHNWVKIVHFFKIIISFWNIKYLSIGKYILWYKYLVQTIISFGTSIGSVLFLLWITLIFSVFNLECTDHRLLDIQDKLCFFVLTVSSSAIEQGANRVF